MKMLRKAKKIPLKRISNKSGDVIKYLSKKSKHYNRFGEVYFSKIKQGYTKGWNLHKKTSCLITVVYGSVIFTLSDVNMENIKKFNISENSPALLIIPPNTWFKFRSLKKYSIISNFTDRIHNKKETKKITIG